MTELRAGELTDDEVEAFTTAGNDLFDTGRAIATAAHDKAMKRAAEVCNDKVDKHKSRGWVNNASGAAECAAAIERELK